MGTHPIFESDFDCLTEGRKLKCLIIQLSVNKLKQEVTWSSLTTHDLSTPIALVNAGSITPITTVVWLLDNKMERILNHVPTSRINFSKFAHRSGLKNSMTNAPIDASQQKSTPWSQQILLNQNKRDSSVIIRLFNFGLTLIYYPLISYS